MTDLLQWLEATAVATFVRESPSLLGYTFVLSMHAAGLAIVVGVNTAISLRLLGVAQSIPTAPLGKLFPVMYTGFTINAISGTLLFMASATTMGSSVMFMSKMVFVVLGFISIELLRAKVFSQPAVLEQGSLPPKTKFFATFSLVAWAAAIISGRLTAYPNFVNTLLGL
jgi:hypothetical protein